MRSFVSRALSCLSLLVVGALTVTACVEGDMSLQDKHASLEQGHLIEAEDDADESCEDDAGQSYSLTLSGSGDAAQSAAQEPGAGPQVAGLCIRTPFGPGQVKLVGCSADRLKDIAVIPETGTTCTTPPKNDTWYDSDGIYVRGWKGWIKVPNHCDTEITCTSDGGFRLDSCCNLCASLIKGTPGLTTDPHGAPSPF